MPAIAIRADRALTPLEEVRDAVLLVEAGRILAVGPRDSLALPAGTRTLEFPGAALVPGFVDVHIHGGGGQDVMDASPDALRVVARTAAKFGTTSVVATTVTASADDTCRALERIAAFIREQRSAGRADSLSAEVLGVHLEGPFISRARRGVHPEEHIAAPSVPLLERLLEAAGECARILTLAPEMPGALELIDFARRRGLVVSMGHTDAAYEAACAAIARGASHAAHVYNAMRPFSHRETGVLGAVLTEPSVTAELIADGVHVDAPAMRILLQAKGAPGVILVSDATAATAMPDGTYRLGTFEVKVANGVCRDAAGRLAGSTLTLDRALRNVVALGVPLLEAVRMITLNPARLLGLDSRKGVLAPGADADLVLLDESLQVMSVMTRTAGLGQP